MDGYDSATCTMHCIKPLKFFCNMFQNVTNAFHDTEMTLFNVTTSTHCQLHVVLVPRAVASSDQP